MPVIVWWCGWRWWYRESAHIPKSKNYIIIMLWWWLTCCTGFQFFPSSVCWVIKKKKKKPLMDDFFRVLLRWVSHFDSFLRRCKQCGKVKCNNCAVMAVLYWHKAISVPLSIPLSRRFKSMPCLAFAILSFFQSLLKIGVKFLPYFYFQKAT